MKQNRGRPKGTTRANGFKVAVDTEKYWNTRDKAMKRKKKTSSARSSKGFMGKVKNGLEQFLRPFYRSN